MRKKSKIYLHMFFSYLGILVIPMALAMVLHLHIPGDYGTGGDHERESSGHGEK